MAENPLLSGKPTNGHEPWTAMDYVRRARENHNDRLESLWLAEARRLGEIPDFSGDKD